MKILRPLLFSALLISVGTLSAQDIHYSLFNMSPLTLNPALTGAFSGSIRIGGIYRTQAFATDNVRGYSTPSVYIDSPVMRGFRKNDWIGVGGVLVSDNAGDLKLTTNIFAFSGAYHLALDKKGKTMLTLGIQGGNVGRSVNFDNARSGNTFGTDIGGEETDISADPVLSGNSGGQQDPNSNKDKEKSFMDWGGGLMLRTQIDKGTSLELGVSTGHVTTPDYAFGGSSLSGGPTPTTEGKERPFLTSAHGRLDMMMDDKWSIAPTFFWQNTAKANEIALQAWAGYQLNPDLKLNFGLGYRISDAGKLLFGVDYKDLKVALAYDVTVSSQGKFNNGQGALELAANYIFRIYKKPDLTPTILCPRF